MPILITSLVLLVPAVALGAWGAVLLLAAGGREAAGDLALARGWARRGGFLLALCALPLSVGAGWLALRLDGGTGATVTIGIGCALAAGVAGLLAGLSRKPRPSGVFAAGLFFAGLFAILSALVASRLGTS